VKKDIAGTRKRSPIKLGNRLAGIRKNQQDNIARLLVTSETQKVNGNACKNTAEKSI